jgi:hypothetical protein
MMVVHETLFLAYTMAIAHHSNLLNLFDRIKIRSIAEDLQPTWRKWTIGASFPLRIKEGRMKHKNKQK